MLGIVYVVPIIKPVRVFRWLEEDHVGLRPVEALVHLVMDVIHRLFKDGGPVVVFAGQILRHLHREHRPQTAIVRVMDVFEAVDELALPMVLLRHDVEAVHADQVVVPQANL